MQTRKTLELLITADRAGTYFCLPFSMPADIETLTLAYGYERFGEEETQMQTGVFAARQELNIIDLGLIAPDGTQVGASGSDKNEISLGATAATPGYRPTSLTQGEWQIIVGAYHVAPAGVKVTYELTFTPKHQRLLKGDLHTHTIASDGVLTARELGGHAVRHGLDFIAVTDHNQPVGSDALPQIPGLTFIQGVEWTHYQGHANFLGVDHPYDTPFISNTAAEVSARFELAHSRGALIVVNHPCDETCAFRYDLNSLPFDCLEIWNGPMRPSNLGAVGLWQSLLVSGKKIPAVGGSDYHRDGLFQILGGPTTGVYAASAGPEDILAALKHGHAFVTFSPQGPTLALTCGEAIMGDSLAWSADAKVQIEADGLLSGDVLLVITGQGTEVFLEASRAGRFRGEYPMKSPGFVRVEILRAFLPGLPLLPALISNPLYFEG